MSDGDDCSPSKCKVTQEDETSLVSLVALIGAGVYEPCDLFVTEGRRLVRCTRAWTWLRLCLP